MQLLNRMIALNLALFFMFAPSLNAGPCEPTNCSSTEVKSNSVCNENVNVNKTSVNSKSVNTGSTSGDYCGLPIWPKDQSYVSKISGKRWYVVRLMTDESISVYQSNNENCCSLFHHGSDCGPVVYTIDSYDGKTNKMIMRIFGYNTKTTTVREIDLKVSTQTEDLSIYKAQHEKSIMYQMCGKSWSSEPSEDEIQIELEQWSLLYTDFENVAIYSFIKPGTNGKRISWVAVTEQALKAGNSHYDQIITQACQKYSISIDTYKRIDCTSVSQEFITIVTKTTTTSTTKTSKSTTTSNSTVATSCDDSSSEEDNCETKMKKIHSC